MSRLGLGCIVLAGVVASVAVPDLRACLRLATICRDLREAVGAAAPDRRPNDDWPG